ncbi:Sas10/Utp3 family protein [Aspergillus campestris IBT 28561]|uniref:Sas10/Utp3 family protein n=1 Tax=Aspergillus campestris (strain IBT 28561) TaxID=1392248 RepID=A0A2I1DGL2_ASPC2|nr:Sas10/Utp3 family protein [Aspergillus campestris IBT 28561]PKY09010.1 Sas10/Utp3 family protein [Aspergillus campestris IBT 28561]
MGKRKASGRPAAQNAPAPQKTKYNVEERFDGSEDEFQAGRDQILLEEAPDAKRRRKIAAQDESLQLSDEEIMGYDSVDEDELDDEDEFDEGQDLQEDDDDDFDDISGKDRKRRGSFDSEDEEGIAAWGSSKKDLYDADQIETEADALEEEAEAKRLQQKHLQAMDEADFGFDESEWAESGKDKDDGQDGAGVVTEVLPQVEITDKMSSKEKMKIFRSRYPEFEPLAKDFISLQRKHRGLAQVAKSTKVSEDAEFLPVPVVKFQALSAYLGAISLYFMMLMSPSYDSTGSSPLLSPAQIRAHPVMASLVKFRKVWEDVKDLTAPETKSQKSTPATVKSTKETVQKAAPTESKKQSAKRKEAQEAKKTEKVSKAQRAAEAAQAEAEARRAEKLRETEANLADLSDLVTKPSKKRAAQGSNSAAKDNDSDFGDEDALTTKEAEEKARQKRSLRFYTSQIAQKANKRTAAGRDAGGDADLPYRERLKDRQARLLADAEKRGKAKAQGAEQLGGDSDDEDHLAAKEIRGEGSDEDEYYDMLAARSKGKKDEKKARAEAYAAAAREGGQVAIQEEVGPDGKRAITYQIEKNKGLAAKRNKDSRNPRVKKRKKYEDKKKKLGSIRQQFKGGEGRGGYGGELTGIKKNLVKSVKL